MQIIVLGMGKVGGQLTQYISEDGHDVTIIDLSPTRIEEYVNLYDVIGVCGNGATKSVLMEAGADLNIQDVKGRTALMDAVLAFKVDVIHYLLAKGADVNKKDNEGCTCLMRASYGGYTDLAIYLLNRGADKTVKDNAGRTALQYIPNTADEELVNVLK